MDSDLQNEEEHKADLLKKGIKVFSWKAPNAFEEQIFFDVPTDVATKIINIAVEEHGIDSVKSRLNNESIPFEVEDGKIKLPQLESEVQKKIGKAAKNKKAEWYKRIDLGELLGNAVFENWKSIDEKSTVKAVVEKLTEWVVNND